MSAEVFLDTNILVYAFDASEPRKRERARCLILKEEDWAVSWQVVQEFCNVALHRFTKPMRLPDLEEYLDLILLPHCRIYPTPDLYRKALLIQARTRYRFYDSLIVASALAAGARTLYTEDLQDGQEIGALRIQNPFA